KLFGVPLERVTLATAGDDRVARVWDARRGVLVSEFSAGYPVVRARFLAGGQALVSTTLQRHASVHEAPTGLFLTRRRELGFAANRVVLSPDGRWAALYARRGKGGLLGVDLPDTPAPPWVADLAEALAGERLRPDGSLERVPPTEFLRLRGELRSLRGEDFWHARLLPGLLDP
ncbi:MAG TPA: hypothetical protein PKE47_02905, partial [Verrucomicrobiota bacterium]|nr:hypothetical protein [Verrucomicrobiota bacterium]